MTKITYQEYVSMLFDPDALEAEVLRYSIVVPGQNAFDIRLVPNPDLVLLTDEEKEVENAMAIGNGYCRWRRKVTFNRRVRKNVDLPIIISEGDSWFQFPFIINETIDNLKKDYLIYSLGAAGDTAKNMISVPRGNANPEYIEAFNELKSRNLNVSGFMFSAAGNDIIGEDSSGKSALEAILKDYDPELSPYQHINFSVLLDRLNFLQQAYLEVISNIRAVPGMHKLPIFIHGYDYVFPYKYDSSDVRNPRHVKKKNEWLGEPLEKRGIHDKVFGREIIKIMLDMLYDMMFGIAADSSMTNVHVVDCRNTLTNVSDWVDEIHGTSDGFSKIAQKFRNVMDAVIKVA